MANDFCSKRIRPISFFLLLNERYPFDTQNVKATITKTDFFSIQMEPRRQHLTDKSFSVFFFLLNKRVRSFIQINSIFVKRYFVKRSLLRRMKEFDRIDTYISFRFFSPLSRTHCFSGYFFDPDPFSPTSSKSESLNLDPCYFFLERNSSCLCV